MATLGTAALHNPTVVLPHCTGLLMACWGDRALHGSPGLGSYFLLSLFAIKAPVAAKFTVLLLDLLWFACQVPMEALILNMWFFSQWYCFGRWVLATGSGSFCFSV